MVPSSDIGMAKSTFIVLESEPEEHPADERREDDGEPELDGDLVDRLLDEARSCRR